MRACGQVRRAAPVHVNAKPRVFLHQFARRSGVIQVNVGQKDRTKIRDAKALMSELLP